jgi:S1-C subfamily serine protease
MNAPRMQIINRATAIKLTVAAMLGAAVLNGLLILGGALGGESTTITIIRPDPSRTTTAAAALDAVSIYARDAGGVVDITARGATDPTRPGQEITATGTGFVLGTAGRLVTAAHVVDGATSITVQLLDGATRTATVLGDDDATDIAVLRIDTRGLTLRPLTLGRAAALRVGDPVAAIGDPFGYRRSLSAGLVSGLDRTIDAPSGFGVAHVIQTDAALNPGNSGGPLLDADGAVVGVVDQIATGSSVAQSAGVGFAVPSDIVAAELRALAQGRRVTHTYVGVTTSDAPSSGARVESVAWDGPGARAGLRTGDVVTALAGTAVRSSGDFVAAIAARSPDDHVPATVRRGGRTLRLTVTLSAQPATLTGQ